MTIYVPLGFEVAYIVIAGLALTLIRGRRQRRWIWKRPVALAVALVMGVLLYAGLMGPTMILVWIGLPLVPAAAIPLAAWVWICWAVGRALDSGPPDEVKPAPE